MFGAIKNIPGLFSKLCGRRCSKFLPFTPRTFHCQRILKNNYEGDGATTVSILNRDNQELIMIDSISDFGFRLNNGMFVVGPVAAFPKSVLQWNISTFDDMNPETLSLFYLLEPKIDILVIGTGENRQRLSEEVLQLFKTKRIALEILPTEHACSTFNFLNVERRCIAGAFLPPEHIYLSREELELIGENKRLETVGFDLDSGDYNPPLPK